MKIRTLTGKLKFLMNRKMIALLKRMMIILMYFLHFDDLTKAGIS